ncbi:MAG: hypothetical protein NW215_00570 [Hyphomicrobiales bacterium]|nr:hypothetical protein [Hyphomicrobiales bacterium]
MLTAFQNRRVVIVVTMTLLSLFIGCVVFGLANYEAAAQDTGLATQYDPRERAAQRKRVMRAFARDLERADKAQQVYKTPYFWYYFNDPERIEAVFNGRFELGGLIDKNYLLELLSRYVYERWASCKASLRGEVRYFEITATTTKRHYGRVVDIDSNRRILGIEDRFADLFQLHFNSGLPLEDFAKAYSELQSINDLSAISQQFFKGTLGKYTNSHFDAGKIVRLLGCQGAASYQFEENLVRALEGRSSVQDDRVVIAEAMKWSDRAFLQGHFGSIGEACYFDRLFMSNANFSDRVLKFCNCLEQRLATTLSPEEAVKYTTNYEEFRSSKRFDEAAGGCQQFN